MGMCQMVLLLIDRLPRPPAPFLYIEGEGERESAQCLFLPTILYNIDMKR